MNYWINVNDRLPEKDDNYLVVVENEVLIGINIVLYSMGYWYTRDKVLYWLPIPELPKN